MKKAKIDRYIELSKDYFFNHKISSNELTEKGTEMFGCGSWYRQLIDDLVLLEKDNETIYKVLHVVGFEIED